jgi:hypothetical protein
MSTIDEVDFISPCPVQDCINKSKSYRWVHSDCGGYEKITNEGAIRCVRCGTSGLFVDWKFRCENHSFKEASAQGVAYALSVMAQLSVRLEEQAFIALLMAKVGMQFLKK